MDAFFAARFLVMSSISQREMMNIIIIVIINQDNLLDQLSWILRHPIPDLPYQSRVLWNGLRTYEHDRLCSCYRVDEISQRVDMQRKSLRSSITTVNLYPD